MAENFAGVNKDSYQVLANRSLSAHEVNARSVQAFCNGSINNPRTQMRTNRAFAECDL